MYNMYSLAIFLLETEVLFFKTKPWRLLMHDVKSFLKKFYKYPELNVYQCRESLDFETKIQYYEKT